jgi:hypothetical protein
MLSGPFGQGRCASASDEVFDTEIRKHGPTGRAPVCYTGGVGHWPAHAGSSPAASAHGGHAVLARQRPGTPPRPARGAWEFDSPALRSCDSAEVVELADTYVREAYGFGRAGSTPAFRTRFLRGVAQWEGHQSPKLACTGSSPVAPIVCGYSSIGRALERPVERPRVRVPLSALSAGVAKLASEVGSNPIGLDGPWGFDSPSRHSSTGALGKR